MGADLILTGFTTKPILRAEEMATRDANARGIIAALIDDPKHWLGSGLSGALVEWGPGEEIDPGDADDTELVGTVLPGLEAGLATYMAILPGGGERWLVSWDILSGKATFHTAGGTSWGDSPFEEWDDLLFFLNVASVTPALAEAIGFLGWGVVVP